MKSPKRLAKYIGFTEVEVKGLCEKYQMDYEEIMEWYDMVNFMDKDDVLTALLHLGYVAFDEDSEEVYLPNRELRQIFERTLKATKWSNVIHAIEQSERLLRATIAGDEEEVAEQIDICHRENSSRNISDCCFA